MKTFALPHSEKLINDYSCAIKKPFLVQGRLYVSQNYVCFFSSLLETEKIIIKIEDIKEFSKEKTAYLIPNAIQITMKDDSVFLFSSFVHRDSCFDEISNQVELLKDRATSIVAIQDDYFDEHKSSPRDLESDNDSSKSEDNDKSVDEKIGSPEKVIQSDKKDDYLVVENDDVKGEEIVSSAQISDVKPPYDIDVKWNTHPIFHLPLSLESFFEKYISDNALFAIEDLHELRGDTEIETTNWVRCVEGMTRLVKYRAKIKNAPPFVPKTTRVVTNVFHRYVSDIKLEFMRETETLDAPSGDAFKVYDLWTISQEEVKDDDCVKYTASIDIKYGVKFTKSVLWESLIVKQSGHDLKLSIESWKENAMKYIDVSGDKAADLRQREISDRKEIDTDKEGYMEFIVSFLASLKANVRSNMSVDKLRGHNSCKFLVGLGVVLFCIIALLSLFVFLNIYQDVHDSNLRQEYSADLVLQSILLEGSGSMSGPLYVAFLQLKRELILLDQLLSSSEVSEKASEHIKIGIVEHISSLNQEFHSAMSRSIRCRKQKTVEGAFEDYATIRE